MKYLKRLTLLLTFIMVLGIPISANAIQDWYGVSDPLQYTSDLHIGTIPIVRERTALSCGWTKLTESPTVFSPTYRSVGMNPTGSTKLFRPLRPGTL